MTDDVLEEWYRLSERIARVPQYDLGKFEPKWGSPFKPWEEPEKRVRLFATNLAFSKPSFSSRALINFFLKLLLVTSVSPLS